MTAYNVVLFLHLLAVAAAFTTALMLHAVEYKIRAAKTVAEIRAWTALTSKIVRCFPFVIVGLAGTGAFLAHAAWSWTTPWIEVSIAGLIVNQVLGNGVSARRGRALDRALDGVPEGAVPHHVAALTRDPLAWSASLATTGITISIIFIMTTKTGLLASAVALMVGASAGIASALPFWARPRVPSGSRKPSQDPEI
jgi:hypothetical protein